ncbi:sulfatase-like hydrolase/transferase [bacterium]|nr:sulfatase-like hydrolase/transferase [bacterium]
MNKKIKRRTFNHAAMAGASSALLSPLTATPAAARKKRNRPNILLIFTDQQSSRAMSLFGNPHVNTPNMDSIANNGIVFTQSYCTAPVCGPSRSSWVTGLMPHQTGVNYNGDSIHDEIPTMGHIFREAGYDTGWSGKWHLPQSYPAIPKPWKKDAQLGSIPGFEMLPMNGDPQKMYPFGDFADQPAADSAIEFIKRKRDTPFLLGVSLHNPHDICLQIMDQLIDEHPSYRAQMPKTVDGFPPLPPNFPRDPHEPEIMTRGRHNAKYGRENTYTHDWDETRWRTYLYEYYRMTERVDAIIGRLLNAVREEGMEEDTLILFTSDHGEGMAAHEWVVKLNLYEEVASVPFAMQWKGTLPAGRLDRKHFVSGIDILPTLADLAGAPLPKPVTGKSLRPLLENPNHPGREYVVTELASDKYNHALHGRMLRTPRYKYLVFSQGENPEMLFDLVTDPGETKNLIAEPSQQDTANRHRQLLRGWMDATDDPFHADGFKR